MYILILVSILSVIVIILSTCSFIMFKRIKRLEYHTEHDLCKIHDYYDDYYELKRDIHMINDNLKIIGDALDIHIGVDLLEPMRPAEFRGYDEPSTESWAVVCTKDENGKQTCHFYQLPDNYIDIRNLMDFLKNMRFTIIDSYPMYSQYFYDKY